MEIKVTEEQATAPVDEEQIRRLIRVGLEAAVKHLTEDAIDTTVQVLRELGYLREPTAAEQRGQEIVDRLRKTGTPGKPARADRRQVRPRPSRPR